jgi:hypothetical protein
MYTEILLIDSDTIKILGASLSSNRRKSTLTRLLSPDESRKPSSLFQNAPCRFDLSGRDHVQPQ